MLLATARPGQRAPGARQTVNLIACGLAIRARRALSSLADETWQDALAVVSLITPALMLIIAALDFAPVIVLMVRSSLPVGSFPVRFLDISVLTIAVTVVVTHERDTVDRRVAALDSARAPGRHGQHPLRVQGHFNGYRGALARQPAVRRARVAGGDRVLAGAGQAVVPRRTCLSRPVRPRSGLRPCG